MKSFLAQVAALTEYSPVLVVILNIWDRNGKWFNFIYKTAKENTPKIINIPLF